MSRRRRKNPKFRQPFAAPTQAPATPIPEETTADPIEQETLDRGDFESLLRTLGPSDVMVTMVCGDVERLDIHSGLGIAKAAEATVAAWVLRLGRFPHDTVSCTCYTDVGVYGPFPVDISLEVNATSLRGGE